MNLIQITPARGFDPAELSELRVEAMRPSLEAAGLFNPVGMRRSFLETYEPEATFLIHHEAALAGFYILRSRPDHLYLNHLYIRQAQQGCGLGQVAVRTVQGTARVAGLPVRLKAVQGSPANAFYVSCGFELENSDEVDNFYIWRARSAD
ncbi:MAG: GNAT family N-acetyltransferase [Pseudomonadota bacterium]